VALVVYLILLVLKPGMSDLMRDQTLCVHVRLSGRPQHDQPEWTAPSGSVTYPRDRNAQGVNSW
jgi:hypothetical protein